MAREYHHGALPPVLRAAAADLIAERGPSSFSLREVARRAGVSHAAPSHHFGDSKGLLTAVAAEGWRQMHASMLEAIEGKPGPVDRLLALGAAYLDFAIDNPGYYGVMITGEYTDHDDHALNEASIAAFGLMHDSVTEMLSAQGSSYEADSISVVMWSTVHGLVEIVHILDHVADQAGTAPTDVHALLQQATGLVVAATASR